MGITLRLAYTSIWGWLVSTPASLGSSGAPPRVRVGCGAPATGPRRETLTMPQVTGCPTKAHMNITGQSLNRSSSRRFPRLTSASKWQRIPHGVVRSPRSPPTWQRASARTNGITTHTGPPPWSRPAAKVRAPSRTATVRRPITTLMIQDPGQSATRTPPSPTTTSMIRMTPASPTNKTMARLFSIAIASSMEMQAVPSARRTRTPTGCRVRLPCRHCHPRCRHFRLCSPRRLWWSRVQAVQWTHSLGDACGARGITVARLTPIFRPAVSSCTRPRFQSRSRRLSLNLTAPLETQTAGMTI